MPRGRKLQGTVCRHKLGIHRERALDDTGLAARLGCVLYASTPCLPSSHGFPAGSPRGLRGDLGILSIYPPTPSHSKHSHNHRGTHVSAFLNQQVKSLQVRTTCRLPPQVC